MAVSARLWRALNWGEVLIPRMAESLLRGSSTGWRRKEQWWKFPLYFPPWAWFNIRPGYWWRLSVIGKKPTFKRKIKPAILRLSSPHFYYLKLYFLGSGKINRKICSNTWICLKSPGYFIYISVITVYFSLVQYLDIINFHKKREDLQCNFSIKNSFSFIPLWS